MDALVQSVILGIRSDLAAGRLVLPSLPEITFQVARLLDDPSSSGEAIAALVGKDPALSARFLRLANSAYFPGMRPVADLRRAIVRLGHKVIKHLITTLAVSKLYDVRAHPAARPHLVELWQQSTMVASNLSPRERQVLRAYGRGENMKAAAARLNINVKTVNNLMSSIREKLGIQEPAALVRYAIKHGYAEEP